MIRCLSGLTLPFGSRVLNLVSLALLSVAAAAAVASINDSAVATADDVDGFNDNPREEVL